MITQNQLNLLRHSLGMKRCNYRRKLSWWLENDNHRNCFATFRKGCDFDTVLELIDLGLMYEGQYDSENLYYYHVTPKGITLAKKEYKP